MLNQACYARDSIFSGAKVFFFSKSVDCTWFHNNEQQTLTCASDQCATWDKSLSLTEEKEHECWSPWKKIASDPQIKSLVGNQM